MTTEQKTLNANDYHINFCGTIMEIPTYSSRLYILQVSGSGWGDQSYWCKFNTTYEVYSIIRNKLVLVGTLNEITGTDGNFFTGTINDEPIGSKTVPAHDIFMKLFKKE